MKGYREHTETLLTAIAFVVLHRLELLGSVSIWTLLALLLAATILRLVNDRLFPPGSTGRGLHARIFLGIVGSTVVIYATGWGPVLTIGYMFTTAMNIRLSGSRAAKPLMIYSATGVAGGQMAIAIGIAPTLIDQPLVHGLAALGALGIVFSVRIIGSATAEREQAEQQLASSYEREQRVSESLRRLNESMKTVASSIQLREMLDAVAGSAKETFGAKFAAVLMKDPEALVAATLQGITQQASMHELSKSAAQENAGPSAVALETGRPVVVKNFQEDPNPRFRKWSEVVTSLGVKSMVAAPLVANGEAIGVLNVYFEEAGAVEDEDVELLMAYAQEATLAIARAQAYEQERTATETLRELDQLKDEFLSTVSHELRTPLTSISGLAETLINRWETFDDELRLDLLGRVRKNAKEMGRLVEQLLDFSRLQTPMVEMSQRPVELREAIKDCADRLAEVLEDHRIDLDIPEGTSVSADPNALDRILGNLLSNASRFSPPGGRIRVGARNEGVEVIVSVSDDGPGIPLEEQERIFERFYQGSGRGSGRSGTGVGLSIARSYTELHGGRIWVESEPGKGSTFFFTLPGPYSALRPLPKRASKAGPRPRKPVKSETDSESVTSPGT